MSGAQKILFYFLAIAFGLAAAAFGADFLIRNQLAASRLAILVDRGIIKNRNKLSNVNCTNSNLIQDFFIYGESTLEFDCSDQSAFGKPDEAQTNSLAELLSAHSKYTMVGRRSPEKVFLYRYGDYGLCAICKISDTHYEAIWGDHTRAPKF